MKQQLRNSGWRLLLRALLVLLTLGGAGCQSSPTARTLASSTINDRLTQTYLDRVWGYTATDAGGYRNTRSFADPPSLYATAWNLRIVAQQQIDVPALRADQTSAWLTLILEQLPVGGEVPPLQALLYTVQALDDLHQPVPTATVQRVLERLRHDERYAYDAKAAPSWAATQTAEQIMRLSHIDVPLGLREAVARDLPRATSLAGMPDDWINTVLPEWLIADDVLPEMAREPLRPALQRLLERMSSTVVAATPDGQALAVLCQIKQIAAANHLSAPIVATSFYQTLQTPDGYLSVFAQQNAPDAQATYYGLLLGMPSSARLAATLRARAGPDGWQAEGDTVDPQASYYGIGLAHSLGDTVRDTALRPTVRQWLQQQDCPPDTAQLLKMLPQVTYKLALAASLQVSAPSALEQCLRRHIVALQNQSWTPKDIMWVARAAHLLALPISAQLRQSWLDGLAAHKVESMQDALAIFSVGRLLDALPLIERSRAEIRRFQVEQHRYRFNEAAPLPDIQSTAVGLYIAHDLERYGKQSLIYFCNERGAWVTTPEVAQGNVVSLQTMYLARILQGNITPDELSFR